MGSEQYTNILSILSSLSIESEELDFNYSTIILFIRFLNELSNANKLIILIPSRYGPLPASGRSVYRLQGRDKRDVELY